MTASRARMLAIAVAAAGCGNGSSYTPFVVSVTDQSNGAFGTTVNTGASKAFVNGIFFLPDTVVTWNGRPVPTTILNGTQAQIQLDPAADTPVAGTAQVSAANGDHASPAASVIIKNGELALTGVDPAQIAPGSAATTISVAGSGFTPATKVIWNDVQLDTTLVSGVQLRAQVPASLLAAAGEGIVQITSSPCEGLFFIGPCQPLTVSVGASTKTTLPGTFNDIAWDATHGQLLVAKSGTIQVLDPGTGTFGAQTSAIGAPAQLAVSDRDQFVYTFQTFGSGLRFNLPDLSGAQTVLPGESLRTITAVPGAPGSIAFFNGGKTGIADGNSERPSKLPFDARSLAFGADASTLYMLRDQFFQVSTAHADATGLTSDTLLNSANLRSQNIFYDRTSRLIYGDAGEVFDEQGSVHPLSGFAAAHPVCHATVIDGSVGKMFIACSEAAGLVVHSFDIATAQPLSRILLVPPDASEIPPVSATASKIVRWGTSGLAVIFAVEFSSRETPGIALYSGPFVR